MLPANFDWKTVGEIRPALLRHSLGTVSETKATDHLDELDTLGSELNASLFARESAARLATGYEDLVVVLLEPSDRAESVAYDDMRAASTALQRVDETLKLAFAGQRDIDNTIILDRWPFRSAATREYETEEDRTNNDAKACREFECILAKLHPKVIIVCQCRAIGPDRILSDPWSSSISKAGDHDIVTLRNGHKCFRVCSFHPMFFEYIDGAEQPLKRVLSEYLFDATFVVAANLLKGRELYGFGLSNLQCCVKFGTVCIISANGCTWSYQYVSERDCCTEELWAKVEPEYRRKRAPFETLLSAYRADWLRDDIVRRDPDVGSGYELKGDVLSRYRSVIRDPPGTPTSLA